MLLVGTELVTVGTECAYGSRYRRTCVRLQALPCSRRLCSRMAMLQTHVTTEAPRSHVTP